jgi:hypothetical protein
MAVFLTYREAMPAGNEGEGALRMGGSLTPETPLPGHGHNPSGSLNDMLRRQDEPDADENAEQQHVPARAPRVTKSVSRPSTNPRDSRISHGCGRDGDLFRQARKGGWPA